jgi:hypothetical protein
MNNTKNILLIAIIAATLVLATGVTPMQSFADKRDHDYKKDHDYKDNDYKKDNDFKSKVFASSEEDKKSAKQHMDQDNECYRGEKCQQANQGQQVVGKDNDAKGFNDQSKNNEQTPPTKKPTEPPTTDPIKLCIGCFDKLSADQTEILDKALENGLFKIGSTTYKSLEEICLALQKGTITVEDVEKELIKVLKPDTIIPTPPETPKEIEDVVKCLEDIFHTTTTS